MAKINRFPLLSVSRRTAKATCSRMWVSFDADRGPAGSAANEPEMRVQGPGCSVRHGITPVEEEPRRCTLGSEGYRERERRGEMVGGV